MMSRLIPGILSSTIGAAALLAVPAIAQEGANASLEEITVTAQRREQNIQDTPVSITAFTPDRLDELGIT